MILRKMPKCIRKARARVLRSKAGYAIRKWKNPIFSKEYRAKVERVNNNASWFLQAQEPISFFRRNHRTIHSQTAVSQAKAAQNRREVALASMALISSARPELANADSSRQIDFLRKLSWAFDSLANANRIKSIQVEAKRKAAEKNFNESQKYLARLLRIRPGELEVEELLPMLTRLDFEYLKMPSGEELEELTEKGKKRQ